MAAFPLLLHCQLLPPVSKTCQLHCDMRSFGSIIISLCIKRTGYSFSLQSAIPPSRHTYKSVDKIPTKISKISQPLPEITPTIPLNGYLLRFPFIQLHLKFVFQFLSVSMQITPPPHFYRISLCKSARYKMNSHL